MANTSGPQDGSGHDNEQCRPVTEADGYRERLRADVHRAVGGSLNLVRELSRISSQVDSSVPFEWMVKRTQFFAYELQTFVVPNASAEARLALLNQFFFEKKKFRCSERPFHAAAKPASLLLSQVLSGRTGSPTVIALLYTLLAEHIGLELEFVDLRKTCFLRWNENGRTKYIDVSRNGSLLSSEELIETLCESLLEVYSFESFLCQYVCDLKLSLRSENNLEKLLFLQNTLISYQPSNVHLLGERALLHRQMGNLKNALSDLKRYFTFCDRDRSPNELLKLFDELVAVLKVQKDLPPPPPAPLPAP
jgi:regulator of sirC expression with transglutaminase-like and TPR domain